MRVAVVILNWNGKKFLEQFLPKVIGTCTGIADVVIADNASTDDSVTFISSSFPTVRTIIFDRNWGFAEGYNKALQQLTTYEYYVLLNSDIEVTSNWIQPVIEFMDKNADYAACQPKLLSYYERDKFEYAGAAGGFIDHLGYPFCRGRIFQNIETDNGQYNDYAEIFWATGACMFVRANAFWEVGGLDGDFFAHMEEIDLCWRLKNNNYKIGYCPDSTVYHIGGGTLPKSSSRKTYLNMRNNIIMLYKNLPDGKVTTVLCTRWFLDFVASIKFLVDGGFSDLWAVIRGHLYFIRHLRSLKAKRKAIKHAHVTNIYKKSIVMKHYLCRIKIFSELSNKDFTR